MRKFKVQDIVDHLEFEQGLYLLPMSGRGKALLLSFLENVSQDYLWDNWELAEPILDEVRGEMTTDVYPLLEEIAAAIREKECCDSGINGTGILVDTILGSTVPTPSTTIPPEWNDLPAIPLETIEEANNLCKGAQAAFDKWIRACALLSGSGMTVGGLAAGGVVSAITALLTGGLVAAIALPLALLALLLAAVSVWNAAEYQVAADELLETKQEFINVLANSTHPTSFWEWYAGNYAIGHEPFDKIAIKWLAWCVLSNRFSADTLAPYTDICETTNGLVTVFMNDQLWGDGASGSIAFVPPVDNAWSAMGSAFGGTGSREVGYFVCRGEVMGATAETSPVTGDALWLKARIKVEDVNALGSITGFYLDTWEVPLQQSQLDEMLETLPENWHTLTFLGETTNIVYVGRGATIPSGWRYGTAFRVRPNTGGNWITESGSGIQLAYGLI